MFFRRKILAAAGTTVAFAAHAAPEPMRGKEGGDILGPRNDARQAENPNLTSPPKTDHGTVPNLRWSFADSHMRLEPGGWARETTVRELPVSTEIAGVNMRLERGAARCGNCTGTRRASGPTCLPAPPASPPSTRTAAPSWTT